MWRKTEITALPGKLTIKTTDCTGATANARRWMGTFAGSNESKQKINTKSTSNIKFGLTAQETVLAGWWLWKTLGLTSTPGNGNCLDIRQSSQ